MSTSTHGLPSCDRAFAIASNSCSSSFLNSSDTIFSHEPSTSFTHYWHRSRLMVLPSQKIDEYPPRYAIDKRSCRSKSLGTNQRCIGCKRMRKQLQQFICKTHRTLPPHVPISPLPSRWVILGYGNALVSQERRHKQI